MRELEDDSALPTEGFEYYRYDGHGRRIRALHPTLGSTISIYSNSGALAFTWDERKSGLYTFYIYLAGSLIATRETNASGVVNKFHHTDALGSPIAVSDAAGTVIDTTLWEPYGGAISKPAYTGVGYTGHYMDGVTGLTYMQQRYYDPAVGRFLSVDPVTADGATGANFNRYWYANNNPYKFTDPDGRRVTINLNKPGTPEWRFAEKYENKPGEISVSGHGSKDHIVDDRSRVGDTQEGRVNLFAADIAANVQAQPDYTPDSTITLLNCNAANGENTIVDKVAELTGNVTRGSPGLLEGNPNNGKATPFIDQPNPGETEGNHRRDPGEATDMRTVDPQKDEEV